ncbi:acetylxylan esterase [Blastopirellula marina]|uniref:Acetylxylan esterase n=2 Tax=Blastopirellula marina TaxID=124 RepID=A0A2S8FP41_9BACT|nr:acetylxylan esterase [Blastopirellula marina]
MSTLRLLILLFPAIAAAQEPVRILPVGQLPQDARLAPPKDLNGYFPFAPPASQETWQARAEEVRTQLKVALGLWPMPPKTPLNLEKVGQHTFDDYQVTGIRFESMPGFFVTGSMYEPVGKQGPFPGVLCPHGHWDNGRFYVANDGEVKKQIASGAESIEETAKNPIQARCVQLARMGCVVFQIDMLGYADSQQLSFDLVHRFGKQRPEMNTNQRWGFFSPQAESHLESVMGLQIWNCIRSLDLLETLDNVDKSRLAVTGASGGATQTMIVGAIDPRIAAVFPAVMVSTAMQGGCTCENCTLLRVGTGNVEFAALFAPKPQGLTAADDWTKEFETKGFPDLKQLYTLMGAEDKVHLTARTEFGHNYNAVSRRAMYELFNQEFSLHASVEERPYQRLGEKELSVWNDQNRPTYTEEFERNLLAEWTAISNQQIDSLLLGDNDSFQKFQEIAEPALGVMVGTETPTMEDLEFDVKVKEQREDYLLIGGLLHNDQNGSQLPALFLYPKDNWGGHTVLWLSEEGKNGLFAENGRLKSEVAKLVSAGVSVAGIDLIYQGEFLTDGHALKETPKVENPREAAAYTLGYNRAVAAQRITDILAMATFMRNHDRAPKSIGMVAFDPAMAGIASVAMAKQPKAFDFATLKTDGFRFGEVDSIRSPNLLPGGAKYGDVPAFLALAAPIPLRVTGETGETLEATTKAYERLDQKDRLILSNDVDVTPIDWVLGQLSRFQ